MTLFEYLSVAASIVLALGVGRLVTAAPSAFAAGRRDWLHASFVVLMSLLYPLSWWRLWPLHAVPSWNFLQFLIVMGGPVSLFLATHVLVSDAPSAIESWRRHFDRAHRWFFAAMAFSVLCGALRIGYVLEDEVDLPVLVFLVAGPLAGTLVSSRRALAVIAAVAWMQTLYLARLSFAAGSQ